MSTVLKFKYYGTPFNVKKIKTVGLLRKYAEKPLLPKPDIVKYHKIAQITD